MSSREKSFHPLDSALYPNYQDLNQPQGDTSAIPVHWRLTRFLNKEPTCRMPKYLKNFSKRTKEKFPKKLFKNSFITPNNQNLGRWFHSFAAKNPYRSFAMLVLSPSFFIALTLQPKVKAKFADFIFYTCLYYFYGTNCALKIKELLRNF